MPRFRSLFPIVVCAGLALPGPAAAADPLLMFLLGFVQNRIETLSREAELARPRYPQLATPRAPIAPAIPNKPAAEMTSSDLAVVVREGFPHLSGSQRDAVLAGLERALALPENAVQREAIVTQFVHLARQVRLTHEILDGLTTEQKEILAERFTSNFRALGPEQQQALADRLRQGTLPLPSDLADMMLARLAAAPAPATVIP